MSDDQDDDRSIWSSRFNDKPDRIQERIRNAPPVPKVKKTRTQAILTALPILMLIAGFAYTSYGERQQVNGSPIESAQVNLAGVFERITPKGEKQKGKHYLWLRVDDRTRPIRIHYPQKTDLLSQNYQPGDAVSVRAAPTVAESTILWLIEVVD